MGIPFSCPRSCCIATFAEEHPRQRDDVLECLVGRFYTRHDSEVTWSDIESWMRPRFHILVLPSLNSEHLLSIRGLVSSLRLANDGWQSLRQLYHNPRYIQNRDTLWLVDCTRACVTFKVASCHPRNDPHVCHFDGYNMAFISTDMACCPHVTFL